MPCKMQRADLYPSSIKTDNCWKKQTIEQPCDVTNTDYFRALGKNSSDPRKISKNTEIIVHFYIIYILLTALYADVFRIKSVNNLLCDLIFKN